MKHFTPALKEEENAIRTMVSNSIKRNIDPQRWKTICTGIYNAIEEAVLKQIQGGLDESQRSTN